MATIKTAIQVYDGMTGPFQSINRAMSIVINSFESLQNASSNAIDTSSIQAARQELAHAETAFNDIERGIREADAAQNQLNDDIRNGQSAADGLVGKIKGIVGAYLGIQGIKKGAGIISDWLGSADVINTAENQLAVVMSNMGAAQSEFESLKEKAAQVESKTTYGAESLLAGAGELATYLQSGKAIEAMMDTMANYAAGMGGINVDDRGMVEYATQLGKALDGQFDGLRKKGFDVSEAQKKILENGTEMERVAVIVDIIGESWDGLAEALANTPQGQIVQMANNFDGIKQKVGNEVYPAVVKFFNTINSNMPTIEALMFGFAYAATVVMDVLGGIINVAGAVVGFFVDNWSMIEPVILGSIAALIVYNATMGIAWLTTMKDIAAKIWRTAVSWAETAAILALIVAQEGLNAALYACPITWILIGVIALIAIFYAAVAAVNHFAGESYSATGMIAGAFAVLGAVIYNLVAYWWNMFSSFFEFIVNAADNRTYAIKRLFANLTNNVLDMGIAMTSGWDNVATNIANAFVWAVNIAISSINGLIDALNSIPGFDIGKWGLLSKTDSFTGTLRNVKANINDWVGEAPATYWEAPKMEMKNVRGAWDTGYNWGANLFGGKDTAEDQIKTNIDGIFDNAKKGFDGDALKNIDKSGGKTAENTAKMAKSIDASQEDLKYLRDLAEQEVVNRFTTAEIKVDMSGMQNNINSELDLDGVVAHLEDAIYEKMSIAAEGDHL
ncbi:hypothetical protein [Peribacillus loiseleuriae]|uniref:Uncharacterized protein n=1 Tax=Peribacillus loiseleuriae TaxID=1679170 RepID=A0A0K9GRH9_9BACI|nr:hypothetical protein [Peribacillus loiseleuriae]KMY49238.1 hypothetical protein AC625_06635 [Peribacillus loiseleuriae]